MADLDTVNRLELGLSTVSETIRAIPEDRWSAQSPCAGWTVLDVLSHVTGTAVKMVTILDGRAYSSGPSWPGDTTSDHEVTAVRVAEAQAAWQDITDHARARAKTVDLDAVVDTPRGRVPLREALNLPIADFAVHAWDLSVGAGRQMELPPVLLQHIRDLTASIPAKQLRSPGLFGPELPPPPGAGPTERLMAWLGRAAPAPGPAATAGPQGV